MSKTIARIMVEKDDDLALKVMVDKGMGKDVYTKENLEVAASKGLVNATKFLSDLKGAAHITYDNKVDAMFVAAQAHQVETVKVLAESGVSLSYAIGALDDSEANRAMFKTIVDTGYHPTASDMHFFRVTNKSILLDALVERNHKDQEIYKDAFQRFITNAEATDDMGQQKAMLKAAATGTAADIDYHIENKAAAENSHWLKNLDVALHFGNDSTAQALIKHGAVIKPEYVQVAEKYTNEATVEAVRTAQVKQTQAQATNQSDTPKKRAKTAKKSQGLSL